SAPQTIVEVAEVYIEREAAAEPQAEVQAEAPQDEQPWPYEHAQNGNGAEHAAEADDAGDGVDAVAARMAAPDLAPAEDEIEDDADDESAREEPKSFARRFVARREARRARKAGGTSLRDRLRGLTAERPET
ncbi:MAG: hypothetical protein AB7V40_08295, partial [Methyloceanibacter sp.]